MRVINREPIEKGWSEDKKYRVTAPDGTPYLLRVSRHGQYARRAAEFTFMQAVEFLGVPMCRPVELWEDEEGVCFLQSWIDGEDAEAVLPRLCEREQYARGVEAGRMLSRIHCLPAPADAEPWDVYFNRKLDRKLALYADCTLKYPFGTTFIDYIAAHRSLLSARPQVWHHGDYHVGNLMVGRDGVLYVIDFNRAAVGDPWEEFNRIVWSAQASPSFASGQVDGYFGVGEGGAVPEAFWSLLALYIASNTLSSLPWAVPFGAGEIETMMRQASEILDWYDGMRRVVPSWYRTPGALVVSERSGG